MPDAITRRFEPLDPYDLLDYGLDLVDSLADGERVISANWSLEDQAILDGLQINTQQIIDTRLIVWLDVNAGVRNAARWQGEGKTYKVFCIFRTNSVPSRTRRKHIEINVKNR